MKRKLLSILLACILALGAFGVFGVTTPVLAAPGYTETLRPNAAGDETALYIGGSSPAATNWESVDEAIADDGVTFVGRSLPAYARDLYELADHTTGSGTINSVKLYYRFRVVNTPETGCLMPAVKIGGIAYEGDEDTNSTTTWKDGSYTWANNPGGGAWNWAQIDALQAGVKLKNTDDNYEVQCTQVYVEVDYTTAPAVTTNAATYVAQTSARLNSIVTDDGGEGCDVRFGYGDETQTAANFALYDTITDWSGEYILHFTGAATSNIHAGDIGDGNKLWMSLWFNLDTAIPAGGSGTDQYLIGKYTDDDEFLMVWIEGADGKIYLSHNEAGVAETIGTAETAWALGWHHILASCSTVVGQRLIADGGTAVDDAGNVTVISLTPDAFCIGARDDGVNAEGFIGEMQNVILGIGDLSAPEEEALYAGTAPTGANAPTEYWYIDEGTGTIIISYGSVATTGTADDANTWETSEEPTVTYTTGQHPFFDAAGLTDTHGYFYRAQIRNNHSTVTSVGEIEFTTEAGVAVPTNLKAFPTSNTVGLTWTKGVGATNTMLRYSEVGYPADETEGTQAYLGPLASYIITSLTAGHTYYIVAISNSGAVYSATVEVLATTTAGGAVGEEPTDPTMPTGWFQSPDHTNLSGLPLYDQMNDLFVAFDIPLASGWFFSAILVCVILGAVVFVISRHPTPAVITLAVSLAIASLIKLLPLYMMAFTALFIIGVWQLGRES